VTGFKTAEPYSHYTMGPHRGAHVRNWRHQPQADPCDFQWVFL